MPLEFLRGWKVFIEGWGGGGGGGAGEDQIWNLLQEGYRYCFGTTQCKILTFILGFSITDLKLKKDGSGLDISPGLHENKL